MRKGKYTSKREELGKDGVEGLLGDEASRTFVLYMGDTINFANQKVSLFQSLKK
jgi:hypothetical protein